MSASIVPDGKKKRGTTETVARMIQKEIQKDTSMPYGNDKKTDVKTKATQKRLKSGLKKIDVSSRSAKAVPITIKIGNRT